MHVAHIITRLILGGAQENTLLSCEDQHRAGDRVTLITGPGLGPEGSLLERALRGGFDVRVVELMRRNIHPWRDFRTCLALCGLLREIRPDLVHTHSTKAGIFGRWAAHRLGIPAVHTIHGPSFFPGQNAAAFWMYRMLERRAARWCARFVSVCDAMTDQYVAAGVAPRSRFVTISSGMEVEPFLAPPRAPSQVRRELGLGADDLVIGKVARLFHLKGHDDVIDAFAGIADSHPHAKLLLVGDGLLRRDLERRLESRGLRDRCLFTGLVPPERVPELIHAMDIVVHASLREGLARVLPQALIAGKPVISYDVDGAREVVIPDETGFLLEPRDVAGLQSALERLADDAALRARLGSTGRARFTDQFRHETMSRRLRALYAEVLADARP